MGDRSALWVLGAHDIGGMGRHALDVARVGLPGMRLSFLVERGPLHEELALVGADLVGASERFGRSVGTRASLSALGAAIDESSACLVHSHLARADLLCAFGPRRGVPCISTEHGIADVPLLYNANPLVARAKRRLHQARLRRTAGVIAVSDATRRSIESQWRPPSALAIRTIYNGVDPMRRHERTTDGPVRLGVLSRLSPEKRIHLVVEALALVRSNLPGVTLAIAGTGDERERLERLVTDHGLDEAVTFMGHADASAFLRDIDLLVQVSAWENCSYSLLDAVNAGRAVVATAVGGNPEILQSSSLVAAEPSVSAIADAIVRNVGLHPSLPAGWPDVSAMASGIARFYDDVLAARERSVR